MAVAFDKKGETFRHKEFQEYKATRIKAPQELYDQIPLVKKVVNTFKIPSFEADGFEADDILATIVKKMANGKNIETFIATGDFDLFQLISSKTLILYPTQGFKEAQTLRAEDVEKKYGISPNQIPDYKGLAGDNSDNIPGVKGIGPKGATLLLQKYKNLENLYEHLNEINGSMKEKLEKGQRNAFMSKRLTTLADNVAIDFAFKDCHIKNLDIPAARKIFADLGFKSLQKRLDELDGNANGQIPLFS